MRVVVSDGDALDLEVESIARAGRCPHCNEPVAAANLLDPAW